MGNAELRSCLGNTYLPLKTSNEKSILKMFWGVFSIGEQPLHLFFFLGGGGSTFRGESVCFGERMLIFSSPKMFFKQNFTKLDQQTKHAFWVRFLVKEKEGFLSHLFLRNDPFQVLHPENLKLGKKLKDHFHPPLFLALQEQHTPLWEPQALNKN